MNYNDYRSKLDQLKDVTPENLIALGKWVDQQALQWLWDELGRTIITTKLQHPNARTAQRRQTLKPCKDKEAVRNGLIVSVTDRKKKPLEPSFYQAQLTMLDSEARSYCKQIAAFAGKPESAEPYVDAFVHTIHRALLSLMGTAPVLLEDAAREIAKSPGRFSAWRRQIETSFEVYKGAEQIVYGVFSGMTHADRAPYMPVAVLRTAIELRLRHAFCISSLSDPAKPDDIVPVDLSTLFEAIKAHQHKIDFVVDVHDVWKIYRWSNFYLHGGVRDYPWVPGFFLQYLRPLFVGRPATPQGGFNIDSGIRMKHETWKAVRLALQPSATKYSLAERIFNAWRALRQKERKRLELPDADPKSAHCVFLD